MGPRAGLHTVVTILHKSLTHVVTWSNRRQATGLPNCCRETPVPLFNGHASQVRLCVVSTKWVVCRE